MKRFLAMLLLLVPVLSMISCGLTMDKIEDRLNELADRKDDFVYEYLDEDDCDGWRYEIQSEHDDDERLDGDIVDGVELGYHDYEAFILEFETKSDAEIAYEVLEEWEFEFTAPFSCVQEGKIVIFGSEKLVDWVLDD